MNRPKSGQKYAQDIDAVYSKGSKGNIGNIYVGNLDAAKNINTLKKLGIKAVISAAKGAFLPHPEVDLPNYLYLPAYDTDNFDISAYFQKTYTFIDKNLERTNVLVHCMAGISRSATIVIAYIIRKHKIKLADALNLVRGSRPSITPNAGFIQQLQHFSKNHIEKHRAATEQLQSNDRRNYMCGVSPEKKPTENRRRSIVSASMERLDSNIQILKNKCLRLELASRNPSASKRRDTSQVRRLSLQNFQSTNNEPQRKSENKNLLFINVPRYEVIRNRKK